MSRKLSSHFSLEEATISGMAMKLNLDNTPNPGIVMTMIQAATKMEQVRALLDSHPITISSWYRAPKVNAAVGSGAGSQHIRGEAIDFSCPAFGSAVAICKKLIEHKDEIQFDQLILEHSWVHISFAILSGKPRGQVLSLVTGNRYLPGLTSPRGIPY